MALNVPELRTERLVLRRWRDDDRAPFAELNADPEAMRYFPSTLDRAASDAFADRIEEHFAEHGWGLWAVEVAATGTFAGFVGLWPATFESDFTPAVEIGWRLRTDHQGLGYATEAALVVSDDGFERLGLDEIVSFTTVTNTPSQSVMRKIGMTFERQFDHPNVSPDSELCAHVLYRLRAEDRST